jgi:hypothetical protein
MRNQLAQYRLRSEFDRLGAGELQHLAQDVGIAPLDLRALAMGNPDAAELLPRRMAALGLKPEDVARNTPEVSRDLQRVCSNCESYGRCMHELDRNPTGSEWEKYCPNASVLKELQAAKTAAR